MFGGCTLKIFVYGIGVMGKGISQVFAKNYHDVFLYNPTWVLRVFFTTNAIFFTTYCGQVYHSLRDNLPEHKEAIKLRDFH